MEIQFAKNPLLTEKQVEKIYPVSRKTLQNWRYACKGPVYHKINRNVFYRLSDLEAFFSQGRIEPVQR